VSSQLIRTKRKEESRIAWQHPRGWRKKGRGHSGPLQRAVGIGDPRDKDFNNFTCEAEHTEELP